MPTPTGAEVGSFLGVLAALLVMAAGIKSLLPKPRTPPLEAEFVTKAEFTKVIDDMRHEMRRGEEIQQEGKMELLAAGERRAASIHDELKKMLATVSRIDERTKKL